MDLKTLGQSAHVQCFSGGRKIYEGYSKGQVANEGASDGFQFVERDTNVPVMVSGQCIFRYE